MPKIDLDRRIGFPIHSFIVTPTHKTMMYYAAWCWSKYFRSENNYDKQLISAVLQYFTDTYT